MREGLAEAIELAIAESKPTPSNEQETCFRIIDPLLKAMLYSRLEIKVQDRDKAKEKPDYTILPDDPENTWFLEAKAWAVSLNDDHAIQAVNYANTQGKRWVALSNGREWRLYDNHILGTVDRKLACVAGLKDETFISFLEALSKPSVKQAKLDDFVRNERLYSYLAGQITSSSSDVVKAITKVLKAVPGLSEVSPSAIVGFLRDYASLPPRPLPLSGSMAIHAGQLSIEPPALIAQAPDATLQTVALGSLSSASITGAKIKSLLLPNGEAVSIDKWKLLTLQAAIFALNQGKAPLIPYFTSPKSKSPLIAKRGSPESERMREPMRLPPPYEDCLVEGHFSADAHQNAALKLLVASGIDPATFQIVI